MSSTYDRFHLVSDFELRGDQPGAVKELTDGLERGAPHQVLLGVTGSGKTFSMMGVLGTDLKGIIPRCAQVLFPPRRTAAPGWIAVGKRRDPDPRFPATVSREVAVLSGVGWFD